MVDLVPVVLVLGGAVLLFAGAALSVYGVALLGVVLGGGGGYLFAPTLGGALGFEGIVGVVAATALGAVAGVVVTYLLLSVAVAVVSFVVGTYVGLVAIVPLLTGWAGLLAYPAAILVGMVAAFVGSVLTRTTMTLVSSFVGATLVSRSVTVADFEAAQSQFALEPLLFDLWSPIFLALFALGVLSQFGLFKLGWVTKIVSLLPGASVFHDRTERS